MSIKSTSRAIQGINNNFGLDRAELVAFFLSSLLLGLATHLYFVTIWIIIFKKKSENLNKCLIGISSTMMLLNVVYVSIDFSQMLQGFIYQRDGPNGPIGYFSQVWNWSHIFKTIVFVLQTCIADSFAIYRTCIVWNRSWRIIVFPILLLMATFVSGVNIVYQLTVGSYDEDLFAPSISHWIACFFVLTLVTTLTCTFLIAGRIWFSARQISHIFQTNRTTLMPVAVILIESAFMYAVCCITLVVVYLLGSDASFPIIDGIFPIISITFNLITVRIALGVAHGDPCIKTSRSSTLNETSSFGFCTNDDYLNRLAVAHSTCSSKRRS